MQGSGYNFNEVLTADGDVTVTFDDNDTDDAADDTSITIADTTSYRVESGGFKPTGSETYENTYINYYNDADGSFLGGMETFGFGAEITIYGADRTVLKEAIDTEALLASFGDNLSSVSEDDLPETFLDAVLPPEAESEDEDEGEGEGGGLAELPTSITVSILEGNLRFAGDGSDYNLVHPGGDLIEFPFGFVEGQTYTIDTSALTDTHEVTLHAGAEDGTEITDGVDISEGSIELTVAAESEHIFLRQPLYLRQFQLWMSLLTLSKAN